MKKIHITEHTDLLVGTFYFSWEFFKVTCEGLVQDLNMGGHMNVSSRWSITNVKKYYRQIGLVICFMFSVVKYLLL